MRFRIGLVALVALVAVGCGAPVPAISSPLHGASGWNIPFGGMQVATVGICSMNGGPVRLDIDLSAADPNTEIWIQFMWDKVHFEDGSSAYAEHGPPERLSFVTMDALEPGECETLYIRSSQYHDSDPWSARPFTYTVAW